ncbi:splicing factor [Tanacetum coccineum]
MYICFKAIKQGWLDACRKVIGLDECFLTHTCKGQLLTAIGRDGNNQMYPIAWVVVGVENKDNQAWFLSLLQEDLKLGYGEGLIVISDGHKGLLEVVAASCTVEQQFLQKMEQIKELDPAAHKWLVERNSNSWCRAFFEMDRCSAAFENDMSESFSSRIVPARGKPIITMLEDIRIYIMQRVYHMNKLSFKLEDTITPSVRKKLEYLKEKQRSWLVYPSAFKKVEVRRGDYGCGVNLHIKKCGCNFWELSGIPCVHAMAAYYHMNMDPELGVNEFLSKQSWYNAYQYFIRLVPGSKLWKPYDNPASLPPIKRKRPGRSRKQRIGHPTKDDNHVFRVGRVMHCHTCWEVGHNKKGCKNQPRPKPPGLGTSLKSQTVPTTSKPPHIPNNSKGKEIDMGTTKKEEYQHKMDMEALAEAENEANDIYWENMAKEFRDDELNRPEDSLEAAYSFDTILEFQDNELNVHQVSMDLPVNEAPENYTTEESQVQDQYLKPTIPTQESQIQTRSKIRKRVAETTSLRIYVKNMGRSKRIDAGKEVQV